MKLAKKYLEEIEKEEKSRAEDKQVYSSVTQRLDEEYLDSVGKLRKKIADEFSGYEKDNVKVHKHKLHKLPVTCVCLSADNQYLFTGSKTQFVIKWDLSNGMRTVGSFDCNKISKTSDNTKKTRPQIIALALSTDFKFLVILFCWYTMLYSFIIFLIRLLLI